MRNGRYGRGGGAMRAITHIFVLLVALLVIVAVIAVLNGTRGDNGGADPSTTTTPPICQHRDSDDDGFCDSCLAEYTDGKDAFAPSATTSSTVTNPPAALRNIHYTPKTAIKVTDTLTPALFGASCYDVKGNKVEINVTYSGNFAAGEIISVVLTAVGTNESKRATIENVKVYGEPTIIFDEFFTAQNGIDGVATAKDSFGETLPTTVTYSDSLSSGAQITLTVRTTDEAKNTVEKQRTYYYDHAYHLYENGICTVCAKQEDEYIRDGNVLYFGEFPQSLKADGVTLSPSADSRGYYRGSDGFYYAKVVASPANIGYTFTSGAAITSGNVYYFKVEPIRWRILAEENGKTLILCESIITNMAYQPNTQKINYTYYASGAPSGTYANNYEYSNIRKWLNAEFYEHAFNDWQCARILTSLVDDNAESTDYTCEDKIFLLSYAEATNQAYGFASGATHGSSRRKATTDYARATGAHTVQGGMYAGNGYWLLRSPVGNDSIRVYCVCDGGNTASDGELCSVMHDSNGVVPAMWITLE